MIVESARQSEIVVPHRTRHAPPLLRPWQGRMGLRFSRSPSTNTSSQHVELPATHTTIATQSTRRHKLGALRSVYLQASSMIAFFRQANYASTTASTQPRGTACGAGALLLGALSACDIDWNVTSSSKLWNGVYDLLSTFRLDRRGYEVWFWCFLLPTTPTSLKNPVFKD